jgi:hypothetical protein
MSRSGGGSVKHPESNPLPRFVPSHPVHPVPGKTHSKNKQSREQVPARIKGAHLLPAAPRLPLAALPRRNDEKIQKPDERHDERDPVGVPDNGLR